MKKISLFKIVTLVTAAGLLAACGGRMEVSTKPEPEQAQVSEETTATSQAENAKADEPSEPVTETATEPTKVEDTTQPEDTAQPVVTQPSELITVKVYDGSQKETTLAEYVSKNKVTMLNFWGTFCGPCIREMPDLAEIDTEFSDKGFGIVGVTIDAVDYNSDTIDPGIVKDAEDIVRSTNVRYPIVYAGSEILYMTQIQVVPTTFFVDQNGYLLTDPIYGSKSRSDWEALISDILNHVK